MKAELDFLDLLQRLHSPELDDIMCFITKLGDAGMVWIVVWENALIFDAILCNVVLKPAFCRVRPCDVNNAVSLLIPRPSDYSFPSGHTAASFAVVSALFFAGEQKLCLSSLVLAGLIAFSRMYLYVHYPTDILGGVLVGWVSGVVGNWAAKAIFRMTIHS